MSATRPRIVGIHLDLKYQMPKKSYLLESLKRLPKLGVNAVLVEYEDKFPFAKYPFLRADDAFTPKELQKFLATARGVGLRVIPLVQTLSHLEFALAHERLAHLREAPDMPTQICPCNAQAVEFVKELLTEVLAYHEADELFHIGADEAWHLGTCPACAQRLTELAPNYGGNGKFGLWAAHTAVICDFVSQHGKRPICWDDALWNTPELVVHLPKNVILHNWNYGVTDLVEGKLPFRQVEVYQGAGYDVVGGPCLNQGTIVPAKNHCLKNTAIWGKKVQATGILGLLNTAWACFHVPMATTWLEIAATGAMFDEGVTIDAAWEEAFLRREFRAKAPGLADALDKLGKGWSLRVEGLARSLAAGVYGYTDMVAWFPGAQTERRRRGAYPLDWSDIDFPALYLKKLAFLRAAADQQAIHAKIDELIRLHDEARTVLGRLASKARSHQAEARLFAVLADMRWLSMKALMHLLRQEGEREALRRQWMALKGRLVEALDPFLESVSVARMLTIWWDPILVALSGAEAAVSVKVPGRQQAEEPNAPQY